MINIYLKLTLIFLFYIPIMIGVGQFYSQAQDVLNPAGAEFNNVSTGENSSNTSENNSATEEEIEVVVGIDKIQKLDFVPFPKINIGNTAILDYQIVPQKQEIIFKGIKPGQTSVIIRDNIGDIRARYKMRVTSNAQSQVVSELRDFLGDIEGLDIGVKGGKVYVGGEIIVPSDIGVIGQILEKYPDVVQLFELSPQTQRIIGDKMQAEMQTLGLKDVKVRVVNKVFWLEGVVTSDAEKELAMKVAEGYLPDIQVQELAKSANRSSSLSRKSPIQNFISINPAKQKPPPPPKMIKIIAQFVELTKDYKKVFGFKWTPTLATGGGSIQFGKTVNNGVTTKSNGTFSGTIANLFPQLSSAKGAGYARVIQQGMVIVKDRTKGKIQKTSNVPFTLGTGEFQRPSSVETGFVLEVRPGILGEERVELGVGLSVAMGSGSNGSTKNQIETSLIVKSLESAVIGGISINQSETQYDKDPPFGRDQVDPESGSPLFSFLKSKSYSTNKSQFVVFITPEIIESASKAAGEIKAKFRQRRR